ncbi:MAG: hypothetical protein U9R48_03235 [Chloroflexota bacterium]|nr:hypothetical protein [Chloroflexota bacterium]
MEEKIREQVEKLAVDGNLSCDKAHALASQLGVSPLQIGRVVNDATNLRFYRCQLGLFGYGPKPEGKHKIVLPAARVPKEIEEAIAARARHGLISCRAIWRVAEEFEYPRLAMANIVEALNLRVVGCQLGCF